MTLKELRITKGLTQQKCAEFLQVSYRTYVRYEQAGDSMHDNLKYRYMVEKLSDYGRIDETHGILSIDDIKSTCAKIFPRYDVEFAYLFGSYAKGKATETSDVDLFVSLPVNGLKFYELVETLREALGKLVDLLDFSQLDNNPDLAKEIFKDGIKIYG